jgi:hypothetical protein
MSNVVDHLFGFAMRFVIATLPDVKFNLVRDLNLVKACALYGDESILFSPTYSGIEPLLDFSTRPLIHQLIYLALLKRDPGFIVGDEITDEERTERIIEAEQKSNELLSKAETVLQILVESKSAEQAHGELEKITLEIHPHVRTLANSFSDDKEIVQRARELSLAQELGLVKIENIHKIPSIYFNHDMLKSDVDTELSQAGSYGALDERFLVEFNHLSSGPIQKIQATRIATDILERLPGFYTATLEEILDIRKELAPYTNNFRRTIVEISNEIQSSPWDDNFLHEVELHLQTRLNPAIAEIETQVQENSYLKEILHRTAKNPLVLPAASAFGLLLSSATQASTLIGQIASGVAGAGLLAYDAYADWKSNQRKIEGNEFFFYFRASRLLKKNR